MTNSQLHRTHQDTIMTAPVEDFMHSLPVEISLNILLRLDTMSLQRAAQTCQSWNTTIVDTDWLWKKLCYLQCDDWTLKEILRDRLLGYSWKDSYIRTCSPYSIKRKWLDGAYSNLSLHEKNISPFMCRMDVETWGRIFELELNR